MQRHTHTQKQNNIFGYTHFQKKNVKKDDINVFLIPYKMKGDMRKSIYYRLFLILTQNDRKLFKVNTKWNVIAKLLEKLQLMSGMLLKVKQYFGFAQFSEEKCKKMI